jgi:hypothetical protein
MRGMLYIPVALLFGGAMISFREGLHHRRFGAIWWIGVAMSAVGVLLMFVVGILSR